MRHNLDKVIRSLTKKRDCLIRGNTIKILIHRIRNQSGQYIPNPKRANDLGNKSWGKIDYLTNHEGYYISYVDKF